MPAIKYSELLEGDSLEFDDRYEISGFAKIHPTARLEPYVVIEADVQIGENTIIGPFVQIRSNTIIGKDCKIGANTVFEGDVQVGNHVRIGTGANFGWGTRIGNNVFIGNNWIGANDPKMVWGTSEEKSFVPQPYKIEDNVKIGLNCLCMSGVTIGEGSIIGMGSLILKSIPPNSLAYGHPLKIKGKTNASKRPRKTEGV